MSTRLEYERDGAAITRGSFALIREELGERLACFGVLEPVVVRMVHAAGDTGIVELLQASDGFVAEATGALRRGATVWCDSEMVARGITRARLPAGVDVRCALGDPEVPELARRLGTTRAAAAVELWLDTLDGGLAVVGNAPTALFRLLELMLDGVARPAAVIGVPVGFIGAAESKEALATLPHEVPYLTLHGRRGGSAMACAAVNALADEREVVPR
ncbi:precorrin-8X methylmutase [Rhabdothermincola sediminis]|uniref:precorrin-8X methylmutase n=1 Tax=Rhabdothermincola sediminis TaxID=2751370 RepID=UPI001AA07DF8|nr:precorrin-8X methylmutase [Rhabdothermincola sediminis]